MRCFGGVGVDIGACVVLVSVLLLLLLVLVVLTVLGLAV